MPPPMLLSDRYLLVLLDHQVCKFIYGNGGFHTVRLRYSALPLHGPISISPDCFWVVGTHYLELYWLIKTLCLGRSWWFSPCHVGQLGHSLQGPT